MKNVKTLFVNNIIIFFIFFNLLLSLIGIFTAFFAAKTDRFDNPLLIALPLSFTLWFLFVMFAKNPQKKEYTEDELDATRKFYGLPSPPKKIPRALNFFILLAEKLFIAIAMIIILINISMMIFISLKAVVVPLICP